MTAEEIKTLIDQKIAGQGTMVDVGGALPTILKEIVDMASQGVKPIALSSQPTTGSVTLAQLAGIGLTEEELRAAAKGERNAVSYSGLAYPIIQAKYLTDGRFALVFAQTTLSNSGQFKTISGYSISGNSSGASVQSLSYSDD